MPGHLPTLDENALKRLRQIVDTMHSGNGRGVPMNDLVQLARDVSLEGGVTVDFNASRLLGHPMVVVRLTEGIERDPRLATLSKREREVADLITRGLSNKQIASQLFIALATVKDHVHNILRKSGLANRAAVAAASRGVSTDPDSRDEQ